MSTMNDFHHNAMDFAALAHMEQIRGNLETALPLFEQALEWELKAVAELHEAIEPTYSVLHRSAGHLALDCNQPRLAEKLVAKALAQDPPSEIAEELRDLLEQVNFRRHLGLKGVELGIDEVQMSLSGREVGLGVVKFSELSGRIDDSSKLIARIAERRNRTPFREGRRSKRSIDHDHPVFISAPRAASFAVTLKLGLAHQPPLPGILDTTGIVDEFMDLMELVNGSEIAEIEHRISDTAYLRNFLGLAKKIAPDGERIRQVGFSVLRGSMGERVVEVTTPRAALFPPTSDRSSSGRAETVEIQGTLHHADATRRSRNTIGIIGNDQTEYTVEVPQGLMNDVVRPMWGSVVIVRGTPIPKRKSRVILLRDIWPIDEDSSRVSASHLPNRPQNLQFEPSN